MKRKAVTLVELIVVLAILGILSASAYFTLNALTVLKLDAAAKRIVSDLRYAQNAGLATSQWYGVTFEVDPVNTFAIYTTNGTVDAIIFDPGALQKELFYNIGNEYSGVKILSVNIDGGNKLEFHPRGIPYVDRFGATLSGTAEIVLELMGDVKTIEVTPVTGKIDLL